MATLQKFKLLATQCAVIGSPSRSPTTSPVIHLRRRKTLRMLLGRTDRRRFQPPQSSPSRRDVREAPPVTARDLRVKHKLKDLFVSSPPPVEGGASPKRSEIRDRLLVEARSDGAESGALTVRRGGNGPVRTLSAALRCRLLRKAWRPVLVTIPE